MKRKILIIFTSTVLLLLLFFIFIKYVVFGLFLNGPKREYTINEKKMVDSLSYVYPSADIKIFPKYELEMQSRDSFGIIVVVNEYNDDFNQSLKNSSFEICKKLFEEINNKDTIQFKRYFITVSYNDKKEISAETGLSKKSWYKEYVWDDFIELEKSVK